MAKNAPFFDVFYRFSLPKRRFLPRKQCFLPTKPPAVGLCARYSLARASPAARQIFGSSMMILRLISVIPGKF
jgi:hypothetical protein